MPLKRSPFRSISHWCGLWLGLPLLLAMASDGRPVHAQVRTTGVQDIDAVGHRVFVLRGQQVVTLNVESPDWPRVLGISRPLDGAAEIFASPPWLVVRDGQGLVVFDIGSYEVPEELYRLDLPVVAGAERLVPDEPWRHAVVDVALGRVAVFDTLSFQERDSCPRSLGLVGHVAELSPDAPIGWRDVFGTRFCDPYQGGGPTAIALDGEDVAVGLFFSRHGIGGAQLLNVPLDNPWEWPHFDDGRSGVEVTALIQAGDRAVATFQGGGLPDRDPLERLGVFWSTPNGVGLIGAITTDQRPEQATALDGTVDDVWMATAVRGTPLAAGRIERFDASVIGPPTRSALAQFPWQVDHLAVDGDRAVTVFDGDRVAIIQWPPDGDPQTTTILDGWRPVLNHRVVLPFAGSAR